MFKAAWLLAKGFLSSLPWQLYAVLLAGAALWATTWVAHRNGYKEAEGIYLPQLESAKAETAKEAQRANDADGRANEFARGLNECVGAKVEMEQKTAATILDRDKRRAAAERALTATRKELNDAYAKAADACAAQPVPDDVLRLLDANKAADADAER